MYRIIYLSTVNGYLDEKQLDKLLVEAKQSNLKNHITGILLHIDGDFIQVLEGEEDKVTALFDRISTDNRHKGIICVIKDTIQKRQFENWSMGFKSTNYQEINKIKGLNNFNHSQLFSADETIALTFLTTFIKSHRNSMNQ